MGFSEILILFHFYILFLYSSIPTQSTALKLSLVPPGSTKSPFYVGNLTISQTMENLAKQSLLRAKNLFSNPSYTSHQNDQTETPRPIVHGFSQDGLMYAVEISIGTFGEDGHPMTYLLLMDTSTTLTWLQCDECADHGADTYCFSQQDPLYPSNRSWSYEPLQWSRDKDLCDPAHLKGDNCYYSLIYEDHNAGSFGQLAYESVRFKSESGGQSIQQAIVIGCGFLQVGFTYGALGPPSRIAGILGLGQGPYALHKQLARQGSGGMFSYCLPHLLDQEEQLTFLQFGARNLSFDSSYMETPLLSVEDKQYYFVSVVDIMVNGESLNIPSSVFQLNDSDSSGGTILDSGTPFSLLHPSAYNALEAYLVKLFSTNANYRKRPAGSEFRLCYEMLEPEGYSNLPTISFVVDGGILNISPEQGFFVGEVIYPDRKLQLFCLVMLPSFSTMTVIGAYQQVNHKFIYDSEQLKLWFKPADCVSDP